MNRDDFLRQLDDLFEVDPGSISGQDSIQDLPGWDSLTFLGLLALVDEQYGVTLSPKAVLSCGTVDDMIRMIDGEKTVQHAA